MYVRSSSEVRLFLFRGVEEFPEKVPPRPKVHAASSGCIFRIKYTEPIMMHCCWNEVFGTASSYYSNDLAGIESQSNLRDEIVIQEVLRDEGVSSLGTGVWNICHLPGRKY